VVGYCQQPTGRDAHWLHWLVPGLSGSLQCLHQDPSNVYEPLVSCAGSFNVGGFCNEEIDAVFQAAKLLPPGDERWNAYAGLESLLVQEMPNINLVHVVNYYYISERVEGLVPDAALLLNFESATINN